MSKFVSGYYKTKKRHGPLSHQCREGKTLMVRPLMKTILCVSLLRCYFFITINVGRCFQFVHQYQGIAAFSTPGACRGSTSGACRVQYFWSMPRSVLLEHAAFPHEPDTALRLFPGGQGQLNTTKGISCLNRIDWGLYCSIDLQNLPKPSLKNMYDEIFFFVYFPFFVHHVF